MRYWIVSVEGRANGKKNIRLFNGSFMIKRFFFLVRKASFLSNSMLIQAILFAAGSTGGSFLPQQMLRPRVDKSPRNATSRSLSKFGIVSINCIDPHVKILKASIFLSSSQQTRNKLPLDSCGCFFILMASLLDPRLTLLAKYSSCVIVLLIMYPV